MGDMYERMRQAVASLAIGHAHGSACVATISIGCAALLPGELPYTGWGAVVQEADAALYEATAQGRYRAHVWTAQTAATC